jgi:hypothetical protein
MKRIYQAPELKITEMQMQLPLMLSTHEDQVSNAGWVKEDRADRGGRGDRSDYNVWNDDWSN